MNKRDELWSEAFSNPGKAVDMGRHVFCDCCSKEYTDSTESGGFLFGSYAYCPLCAADSIERIKHFKEENRIKAYCPEGTSFADFVRGVRGGNNTIQVTSA